MFNQKKAEKNQKKERREVISGRKILSTMLAYDEDLAEKVGKYYR